MSPRTVFVTYVFPPDESPRAVQIGRLAAHSSLRDLHVVCAEQGAVGDRVHEVPWGAAARLRRDLRWKTIRSRLLVPDAYRPWARGAARAARRLAPEVVVTFGQPMSDHVAGLVLKRRTGVPWIAHFSDPWVDNPFRSDDPIARAANRRLERRVVAGADRLVFTSSGTVEIVMAKYPAGLRDKARVIPHAFDPARYPDAVSRPDGAPVVVRHLGAFYGPRTAAPLLRALTELHERDSQTLEDVRVELWGPSETPVDSLPEFGSLPPDLVSVHGNTGYAHSLELMRSADLLVVVDAPAARSVFLPSKLVDYVGARRPLLALTPPGAARDLVERMGGWFASPDDPQRAAEALAAALQAARENGRRDWGAEPVRAEYDPETVARRMDDLVTETAEA